MERPPFPPDVRARLDPNLFICDICGADLEHPATLCRACRIEAHRDRNRRRRELERHRGLYSNRTFSRRNQGGFSLPPDDVKAYRDIMGNFAPEWLSTPDFRRDPCAFCGSTGPNTLDHIDPYSKSHNSNPWDNATSACKRCNMLKDNMSLFEFLSKRSCLEKQYPKAVRSERRMERRLRRNWLRYTMRQREAIDNPLTIV